MIGSFNNLNYFLYISVLLVLMLWWVYRRSESLGLSSRRALDICLVLMISGFIGGRALHVIFEAPTLYREKPSFILFFWLGGFVFYGGFLLALASTWLFLKLKKDSFLAWADFFAPIAAATYGLGRGACFLAGCCYGKACDWGVDFGDGIRRHPTQLYAMAIELVFVGILFGLARQKRLPQGGLFYIWLILHGSARIYMESFRDDFRGQFILGLSISVWISYGIVAVSSILLVRIFRQRLS